MNFKDFFYFSPRERRGILVLIALIVGVFIGKYLFGGTKHVPQSNITPMPEATNPANNKTDSVSIPIIYKHPEVKKQLPPAEEKRTYYAQPKNTANYAQTEKYAAGTVIDLNIADSLMLCKVPGIGASFSKRIISYRKLLGGYHRPEQLQEVYGMYVELYEKIVPFFSITADSIQRLSVNKASVDQLKRHPYINFYQAKAIEDLRKKKGSITSLDEIRMLEPFNGNDYERIYPYLEL